MNQIYTDIHRDIIESSIRGDTRAQYQLYSLYATSMFNVCMRILGNREEAEDALQDAFSLVFEKLDSFAYRSSFGAWVKRIVVNSCLNHLRKKNPEMISDSDLEPEDHSPEEELNDHTLQVKEVLSALEKLPDGYRTVLSLYLFEGYDHEEIASILGISENTSRTQYMKAKIRLKEHLKKV